MMLINSLLAHATDARWEEFVNELEKLNVRKAVIVRLCGSPTMLSAYTCIKRLMSSHTIEDLTSCILDFQANMIRVTYRKKTTLVEPEMEHSHASALKYIWNASKLQEGIDEEGQPLKWRLLGFGSEDITHEFRDAGVLGLDCLVSGTFVM